MSKKTLWPRLGGRLNPGPQLPSQAQKQAAILQLVQTLRPGWRREVAGDSMRSFPG